MTSLASRTARATGLRAPVASRKSMRLLEGHTHQPPPRSSYLVYFVCCRHTYCHAHCNRGGSMMALRERAEKAAAMTIMRDEILEQPGVVAGWRPTRAVRAAAAKRAPPARASCSTPPAARATTPPSTASTWPPSTPACRPASPCPARRPSTARRIDFRDCLVIGISQSGETPDVAEYVAQARAGRRLHAGHHQRRRQPAGARRARRAGDARRP